MTPKTSPFSRPSRRFAGGPACTSAPPALVAVIIPSTSPPSTASARRLRGTTTVTFLPDGEIFEETDFSFDTLSTRMREMAFLTRGLRLDLIDERAGGQQASFHFEGGIRDFIAHVNEGKEQVHPQVIFFENDT